VVGVSKYQSVNEAVKWTEGLLEGIFNNVDKYISKHGTLEAIDNHLHLMDINDYRQNRAEFFKDFPKTLEDVLISGMDENNRLSREISERIYDSNLSNRHNVVDLRKAVDEALKRIAVRKWLTAFIDSDSKVSPTHFIGKVRPAWKYHYDSKRNFGQTQKQTNTKTNDHKPQSNKNSRKKIR